TGRVAADAEVVKPIEMGLAADLGGSVRPRIRTQGQTATHRLAPIPRNRGLARRTIRAQRITYTCKGGQHGKPTPNGSQPRGPRRTRRRTLAHRALRRAAL